MTEREKLIDLIVDAKRTDPETGSFSEWLAAFLLDHGVMIPDDDCDLDHLRKLVDADMDGRCIILPVKLGARIFVRYKNGESPVVVESIVVGAHIKDEKSYRGAPRKEYIVVRSNGFSKHINVDQIGKTAFFTREKAFGDSKSIIPVWKKRLYRRFHL